MDKSLDEVITERQNQRSNYRGRRNDRRNDYPRDGIKKTQRDDSRNLDKAWTHDRYEDDNSSRRRPRERRDRDRVVDRYSPEDERSSYDAPAKLRIDNLHYDLSTSDLRELFSRIGHVTDCEILYDRSDRSRGIAFVTYSSNRDAKRAIRDFDGANAYGQPIQLTLMPSGPSSRGGGGAFNDTSGRGAVAASSNAGRSLFDRIDSDTSSRRRGGRRDNSPRNRSYGDRKMELDRPEGVDRYVPSDSRAAPRRGGRSPRDNSNAPRRNGGNGAGRRPGARRDGGERDVDGHKMVGGRPRKTAEELDAEMEDYWGSESTQLNGKSSTAEQTNGATATLGGFGENSGIVVSTAAAVPAPAVSTALAPADGDIDMIE